MKYQMFLLVLVIQLANAQQSVRVTYEMVRTFPESFFNNIPEDAREDFKKEFAKPLFLQVTNNGEYSLSTSVNSKDSSIETNEGTDDGGINLGIVLTAIKEWRLKNLLKAKQTILVDVENENYYIEQPLKQPNLIFTNKELFIDKFKCKYAYAISKENVNDTIKYWYAPDIPIDDGPTDEIGFPGLVLKIQTKNSIEYATKIEFFDKKLDLVAIDPKIKMLTIEEFDAKQTEADRPKTSVDSQGRPTEQKSKKMSEK